MLIGAIHYEENKYVQSFIIFMCKALVQNPLLKRRKRVSEPLHCFNKDEQQCTMAMERKKMPDSSESWTCPRNNELTEEVE